MGAEQLATSVTESSDPIEALIQKGSHRDALAACARVHGAAVGRLCMAFLGNQAEAEEATQESLLAAYDAMEGFRGSGSVKHWLFAIARRVCARRVETRLRREARLRLVRAESAETPGAEEALARRRRGEQVRQALEHLKPSERDAVVLRYAGELSFREVALACGTEEATVRKRVSRALERLRSLLVSD